MEMDRASLASFFEHVYEVVRFIPAGRVATYGQIATIVSHAGAARTVGWALGALREGTDVPWHRVINSRGQISLRPQGGGAEVQKALLEQEGVRFDEKGRVNLALYQWEGLDWPEVELLRQKWNQKPRK